LAVKIPRVKTIIIIIIIPGQNKSDSSLCSFFDVTGHHDIESRNSESSFSQISGINFMDS